MECLEAADSYGWRTERVKRLATRTQPLALQPSHPSCQTLSQMCFAENPGVLVSLWCPGVFVVSLWCSGVFVVSWCPLSAVRHAGSSRRTPTSCQHDHLERCCHHTCSGKQTKPMRRMKHCFEFSTRLSY